MAASTTVPAGGGRAIWLLAALGVAQCLALAWWLRLEPVPDTATSGAWSALAADAARGIFYRPIAADGYFGGTRYMPLFFLLHAGLIKTGFGVVAAGRLLMAFSAAVFLTGIHAALRTAGAGRERAAAFALLGTTTVAFQLVLASVRGDLLAAGLGLWGWALALRRGSAGGWAAGCFAAALLTKFTAGFGLLAALGTLSRAEEGRPRAVRLVALTAGLTGLAVAAALAASGGRLWDNFSAFSAGDGGGAYALAAPWHALVQIARDPVFAVFTLAAIWTAWRRGRSETSGLWLVAAGCALVVFASRGTDGTHHLLEWQGATFVLLGAGAAGRWVRWLGVVLAAALGLMLAGGLPSAQDFFARAGRTSPEFLPTVQAAHAAAGGAVLADDALLPLLLGERPVVADAHSLALWLRGDPARTEHFQAEVRKGRFGIVVLRRGGEDYRSLSEGRPADPAPFYPGFSTDLAENYTELSRDARWILFVRKNAMEPARLARP